MSPGGVSTFRECRFRISNTLGFSGEVGRSNTGGFMTSRAQILAQVAHWIITMSGYGVLGIPVNSRQFGTHYAWRGGYASWRLWVIRYFAFPTGFLFLPHSDFENYFEVISLMNLTIMVNSMQVYFFRIIFTTDPDNSRQYPPLESKWRDTQEPGRGCEAHLPWASPSKGGSIPAVWELPRLACGPVWGSCQWASCRHLRTALTRRWATNATPTTIGCLSTKDRFHTSP